MLLIQYTIISNIACVPLVWKLRPISLFLQIFSICSLKRFVNGISWLLLNVFNPVLSIRKYIGVNGENEAKKWLFDYALSFLVNPMQKLKCWRVGVINLLIVVQLFVIKKFLNILFGFRIAFQLSYENIFTGTRPISCCCLLAYSSKIIMLLFSHHWRCGSLIYFLYNLQNGLEDHSSWSHLRSFEHRKW